MIGEYTKINLNDREIKIKNNNDNLIHLYLMAIDCKNKKGNRNFI